MVRIKFLAVAVVVAVALGMATIFLSHEPLVVDPPTGGGGGQSADPGEEEPRLVRLAADPTGRGTINPSDISRARLRSLLTKLSRTMIPSRRQTLIDKPLF